MTDQRELDRLLDAFFVEGPDELADRVIEVALDEIDHTRQRRAVRLPRGFPTMNLITRLAAAAVIGVLVVAGTLGLIQRGQPGFGGPGPTPGASASPSPPASPSPSPVVMPSKAVYVAGTEAVSVTTPGTQTQAGDVTRLRGRIVASVDTMDDPRVTGTGTMSASFDMYGTVGPQWGTYRLENAGGAWEGKWTGALWKGGQRHQPCGLARRQRRLRGLDLLRPRVGNKQPPGRGGRLPRLAADRGGAPGVVADRLVVATHVLATHVLATHVLATHGRGRPGVRHRHRDDLPDRRNRDAGGRRPAIPPLRHHRRPHQ